LWKASIRDSHGNWLRNGDSAQVLHRVGRHARRQLRRKHTLPQQRNRISSV